MQLGTFAVTFSENIRAQYGLVLINKCILGVTCFSAVVLEHGVVFKILILRCVKETWKIPGTGTARPVF